MHLTAASRLAVESGPCAPAAGDAERPAFASLRENAGLSWRPFPLLRENQGHETDRFAAHGS